MLGQRASSVGIATRLWAGRPGFDSPLGQGFPLLHNAQTGSGAHPASYTMDTGVCFSGAKAAGA
jgi:hypothetical protein